MISLRDIEKSIIEKIKIVFSVENIYRDKINHLKTPAFKLNLISQENRTKGFKTVEKMITLDIVYYSKTGEQIELLDVKERLDNLFNPFFRVKKRAIKPHFTESTIVEDDLHFLIYFSFYDEVLNLIENTDVVYDEETGEIKEIQGSKEKMTDLFISLKE